MSSVSACLDYLGLAGNPFPVVPDVENFYVSPRLESLMTEVLHAIHSRKGFIVITGEVGLGKTTISRRLLKMLEEDGVDTALVFNTCVQGVDLLRTINRDFGVEATGDHLEGHITALNAFLLERNHQGRNCTLIIDDAQNLSAESLELIRLVSNLETDAEKLIQILLIGQPELSQTLNAQALRQLRSRVVINAEVGCYNLDELRRYVYFKLNAAGGNGRIDIPEQTMALLHRSSGGNPRQVNLLMDRCLYAACAAGTNSLIPPLLREAALDLGLKPPRRGPMVAARLGWMALPVAAVAAGFLYLTPGMLPGQGVSPSVAPPNRATAAATPEAVDEAAAAPAAGRTGDGATPLGLSLRLENFGDHRADVIPGVRDFLAQYGLEAYGGALSRHIRSGDMADFAQRLHAGTGYRLLLLQEVPQAIRRRYGLLRVGRDGVANSYLVLWQPDPWLEPYRRDADFGVLQTALKRLNFYHHTIDGQANDHLRRGLAAFQRAQGLPPTGEADELTQLLLETLITDGAA